MDRRSFLTLIISGLVSAGCQSPAPPPRRPRRESDVVEIPKPAESLPPPKPAAVAPTAAPTRAVVEPAFAYRTRTTPPERIIAPSIGLDAKVIQLGTTVDKAGASVWETAAFAAGHHRGSANPGEPGNVVLSGHISSPHEGAVFKQLPNLKVGEGIILVTPQQHHMYVVRDIQVVKPNAVEVLNPTANAIATLITCVPDGVYTHRLIVRCDAV